MASSPVITSPRRSLRSAARRAAGSGDAASTPYAGPGPPPVNPLSPPLTLADAEAAATCLQTPKVDVPHMCLRANAALALLNMSPTASPAAKGTGRGRRRGKRKAAAGSGGSGSGSGAGAGAGAGAGSGHAKKKQKTQPKKTARRRRRGGGRSASDTSPSRFRGALSHIGTESGGTDPHRDPQLLGSDLSAFVFMSRGTGSLIPSESSLRFFCQAAARAGPSPRRAASRA